MNFRKIIFQATGWGVASYAIAVISSLGEDDQTLVTMMTLTVLAFGIGMGAYLAKRPPTGS
jgi:hypothetical protein